MITAIAEPRQHLDLGRWCILLVSAQNTLRLATSLNEAGYDAWTPIETTKADPKAEPVKSPMMRGFVFARADRLADLLAMTRSPVQQYQVWDTDLRKMVTKGHPWFRVMPSLQMQGGWAMVRDNQLAALRLAERKRKPRGEVKTYAVGDKVRLVDGSFAGLRGVVVAVKGKNATISFPQVGFLRDAVFPMWILIDDVGLDEQHGVQVSPTQREQALIAKAA